MEMPVPLEPFAKARHSFAAPVLAPQSGDPDPFFNGPVQNTEGPLVSALRADDQAVVDPVGKFRLASQECRLLFQKTYEIIGRFYSDVLRHLPELKLVEVLIPEIEVRIRRALYVHVVLFAGYKGRLREVGVVVIAAAHPVHIPSPGDVGGLVPSDSGFSGPQREVPAPHVKIGHLLAAPVYVLGRIRVDPDPEAVDPFILLLEADGQKATVRSCYCFQVVSEHEPRAFFRLRYGGDRQRPSLDHVVVDPEVASVHQDIFLSLTDIDHRMTAAALQNGLVSVLYFEIKS